VKDFWAEFGPFWWNWPNLKKEVVWPVPAKMGQIWRTKNSGGKGLIFFKVINYSGPFFGGAGYLIKKEFCPLPPKNGPDWFL